MNTAEMWLAAQEDGEVYYSKDAEGLYSKELGLVEREYINEKIDLRDFPSFEDLMKSEWKKVIIMNKKEVYEKFGVMVIDWQEDCEYDN